MATDWQRPKSIHFTKVWKTFKGLTKIDGKIPEFRIQDIAEDQFDVVLDMMVEEFVEDETSITEARNFWRKALEQRLSLVCLVRTKQRAAEIVSISINCRTTPSDSKITFKGKKFGSSWLIRQYLLQKNNFYEQFNVGEVITGMGGFTVSKYSGQNVSVEMIKCRELLCRAIGIKMTFVITIPECREDMKSVGFKDYTTATSEELHKITKMPFSVDGQCVKLMYNSYE